MPKVAFIGAGSTVFAKNLIGDILSYPELAGSTLSLYDIDAHRLHTSEVVARKLAQALDASPTIEATLDRCAALDGADYAIAMFQIGGYKPSTVIDFEIPKRHGLRATIADTLGVGGIMRALRTIPVFLDICRDMEQLCPDAHFLQYVNPMAANCWAINRASSIRTVGLCHSVQGTAEQLARDIHIPVEEINYLCAGINHVAFYLRFEREGRDRYQLIRQVKAGGIGPGRPGQPQAGRHQPVQGGLRGQVGLAEGHRHEQEAGALGPPWHGPVGLPVVEDGSGDAVAQQVIVEACRTARETRRCQQDEGGGGQHRHHDPHHAQAQGGEACAQAEQAHPAGTVKSRGSHGIAGWAANPSRSSTRTASQRRLQVTASGRPASAAGRARQL